MAKKKVKKVTESKPVTKSTSNNSSLLSYGSMIFGVSLGIALLGAIFQFKDPIYIQIITATLIVLGIILGMLNITEKETVPFLVSLIAFVFLFQNTIPIILNVFGIGKVESLVKFFQMFTVYIIATLMSAGLVVSLKTFFNTAKDEK